MRTLPSQSSSLHGVSWLSSFPSFTVVRLEKLRVYITDPLRITSHFSGNDTRVIPCEQYGGIAERFEVSDKMRRDNDMCSSTRFISKSIRNNRNVSHIKCIHGLIQKDDFAIGHIRHREVPSRFFRKLIEAASAPPCSSPPPSCSARPSPPASTCPGTSSCPIRAPRCTSASPSPASGPSCRPGRSLRLSSSA